MSLKDLALLISLIVIVFATGCKKSGNAIVVERTNTIEEAIEIPETLDEVTLDEAAVAPAPAMKAVAFDSPAQWDKFSGTCSKQNNVQSFNETKNLEPCADLSNRTIEGDIRKAKLHGANLVGADLREAKVNLYRMIAQEVVLDETTLLPARFDNNLEAKVEKILNRIIIKVKNRISKKANILAEHEGLLTNIEESDSALLKKITVKKLTRRIANKKLSLLRLNNRLKRFQAKLESL